jgi:DivIVA domain-containing protein
MSSPDREAGRRAAKLGPEAIARTTFPTSFRGYDADHVRVFLEHVAEELREARDREAALRSELEAAEARLGDGSELDEDQLTARLGEETARIVAAAREAAAEIKAKASENAERLLRESQEEASALKSDAETMMARRTEEAETEAARIRSDAEDAVASMRADGEREVETARTDADRIRAEAEEAAAAEVEAAKERGREMVDEALAVRTRVLEDLARKRKASRVKVERLQAGRERLLESYDLVRRTLDEATDELRTSLSSAKVAADAAAWRVEAEPLPSSEDLEREVDAAREAGLLDVVEEPPDYAEELPQEDMVPVEPAAEFENVRVVEAVEVVEVAEVVGHGPEEDEETEGSVDVDDLFARIRASREAEVAKAQEVLAAEPEPEAEAEPEAEPPPEAAAESEVETTAAPDHVAAPPSDDQVLLERRDAVTDVVEKQALRKLKRVLADEQNEVLDRLRRNPKAKLGDLFPGADEHAERYAAAIRTHLDDVAKRGGSFYGDEPATTDVNDLAADLGQALTLPLRDRVEGSLRESAGDEEAMADGVRAVYRDWKTHRVASQTRDTVISAFNRGLFDATSTKAKFRWVVDNGGQPCPDAEDNSLAGLVDRGEEFPTGHCYPPAHPGCRCLLVPAPH